MKKFDNYKIVQITDVHSIRNEIELEKITNKVKKENPNIICVTGDLIDAEYYSSQNALYENKEIKQIEEKPIKDYNKRKDKIIDKVIGILVGIAITYIAIKLGLGQYL